MQLISVIKFGRVTRIEKYSLKIPAAATGRHKPGGLTGAKKKLEKKGYQYYWTGTTDYVIHFVATAEREYVFQGLTKAHQSTLNTTM